MQHHQHHQIYSWSKKCILQEARDQSRLPSWGEGVGHPLVSRCLATAWSPCHLHRSPVTDGIPAGAMAATRTRAGTTQSHQSRSARGTLHCPAVHINPAPGRASTQKSGREAKEGLCQCTHYPHTTEPASTANSVEKRLQGEEELDLPVLAAGRP